MCLQANAVSLKLAIQGGDLGETDNFGQQISKLVDVRSAAVRLFQVFDSGFAEVCQGSDLAGHIVPFLGNLGVETLPECPLQTVEEPDVFVHV